MSVKYKLKFKDEIGTTRAYEMYLKRLERFAKDKEALQMDLEEIKKTNVLPKDEKEDLINLYTFRINKLPGFWYADFEDGSSPFESFEELTRYAKKYNLKTEYRNHNEGRNPTHSPNEWIISGSKQDLEKFLDMYYNESQKEMIFEDSKFKDAKLVKPLKLINWELSTKEFKEYYDKMHQYLNSGNMREARKWSEELLRALRRRRQELKEELPRIYKAISKLDNDINNLENLRHQYKFDK